jgi:LysR family transcriptional regulator, transcriptional activator of nhaA
MEWINYQHLLYFWTVSRLGGLAEASEELRLAPSTLSGQMRILENALERKLFAKKGRRLILTETGRVVFRYADEIFTLGRELLDTLQDRPVARPMRVTVGVADVVPKLVARDLLTPALRLPEPVHLICREGRPDQLLMEMALHELDLVLSDAPADPQVKVRAFSHLLGESEVLFFAPAETAARYRRKFPFSLDGAPALLPTQNTAIRRSLDHWFDAVHVHPRVIAEFADSALLKAFGMMGLGVFPAPACIASQVKRQFNAQAIGSPRTVKESFYAITVERRIENPAVVAICEGAREHLGHDPQVRKVGKRPNLAGSSTRDSNPVGAGLKTPPRRARPDQGRSTDRRKRKAKGKVKSRCR